MKGTNRFLLISIVAAMLIMCLSLTAFARPQASSSTQPPSETIDYVFHNKGNIVTTILNWGLMGGYSDVPRGEWPKGTGRNYLAEIKYWMGATLPNGDTVVADTDEDLTPEPNWASAEDDYSIRLSTDPNRYEYDQSDTVGISNNRPAYGWRTYDLESGTWEYNQIYNPADSSFFMGGPIALQESQYLMSDARDGSEALGLLISQTVYQWNYPYNENYLFVVLEIKNTSENDYTDFAFGLYCDFDVGGYYQGENGRLGDLVTFDSSESLAWTYDEDNYDPGWGASVVAGRMGTKYIETPGGMGMTSFRTGIWDELPDTDEGRFALINSEQFDQSLPPNDQYYIQCTRGINLAAGDVVRVVYALVAGQTDEDLKDNAAMAQVVYDNFFTGPEPPVQPKLTAVAGDKQVKLFWDNSAENSVDPMTGEKDFLGYKVYRSSNFGSSWGELTFNSDGSRGPDYIPIAEFRLNETTELIQHTYIDTNLVNGFEYWYAVVAYDEGDPGVPVASLQSARGRPGEDSSAVRATPRTDPAGYWPIQKTIEHVAVNDGITSDGQVAVELFNQAELTSTDFKVVFEENIYQTVWHLLDAQTGDTLLADQTNQDFNPESAELVQGLRVMIKNGDSEPRSIGQTEFSGTDTTVTLYDFWGAIADLTGYPRGGDMHYRSTYEFRFTESGSEGYWWWDDVTPVQLPFEVWNTSLGYQVIAEIGDLHQDGVWDPQYGDYIVIVNHPYDGNPHPEAFPYQHCWAMRFHPTLHGQTGDVFTIKGAPLNSADDEFYFSAPLVDEELATQEMADIKVVPNPYIAYAEWEHEAGERRIEFIHLPNEATIRIFTLAGDLVVTLRHSDGTGTASWDVQSINEQSVAPGIYYYHVESPYGNKIGKFAIIK